MGALFYATNRRYPNPQKNHIQIHRKNISKSTECVKLLVVEGWLKIYLGLKY